MFNSGTGRSKAAPLWSDSGIETMQFHQSSHSFVIDGHMIQPRKMNSHSLCAVGIVVSFLEDSDLLNGKLIRRTSVALLPPIVGAPTYLQPLTGFLNQHALNVNLVGKSNQIGMASILEVKFANHPIFDDCFVRQIGLFCGSHDLSCLFFADKIMISARIKLCRTDPALYRSAIQTKIICQCCSALEFTRMELGYNKLFENLPL